MYLEFERALFQELAWEQWTCEHNCNASNCIQKSRCRLMRQQGTYCPALLSTTPLMNQPSSSLRMERPAGPK
jgi:hypothetical protein